MPLLFSILEPYNLLSKHPNYTCGLFFFHLMFMVISWARAIMSISKKGLDFSREAYYYIFPKIDRKPNKSKTEGRNGHTGPPGQPRGEELPCRFLSCPGGSWGDILGPGAALCAEELLCRFISRPVTLSRTGHTPPAPDTICVIFKMHHQTKGHTYSS